MYGLFPTQSRPYLAESSNICNESHFGAPVPVRFGTNNLLVSHGQQRNVHDTTNMAIVGNNPYSGLSQPAAATYNHPYFHLGQQQPTLLLPLQQQQAPLASYMYNPMYQTNPISPNLQQRHSCTCCPEQNVVQLSNPFQYNVEQPQMHRRITAYGVDFGFGTPTPSVQNPLNGPPQQNDLVRTQYDQLNLQQQIALKQLEKHSLETILLQEQLKKNPFLLQFHHDKVTSTDDLFHSNDQRSISKAMPDMQAAAAQCILSDNMNVLHGSVRQLRLTKSPDLKYSSNIPQTPRGLFDSPMSESCVCSTTRITDQQSAKAKVSFDEHQSSNNINQTAESQGDEDDQSDTEDPINEYSVETPISNKFKRNKKREQLNGTCVKYSVEEPDDNYNLSSDGRSYSSPSNDSDSEEDIASKRIGVGKFQGRRSKRKNTKKQIKKKSN